jgi:hypothetical protein
MKSIFVLFVTILVQVPALAYWDNFKPANSLMDSDKVPFGLGMDLKYQIGPEWGKKVVTTESLKSESVVFQKAARRTAKFGSFMGGATAFYLGKFNGHHVIASNYHVITSANECSQGRATFTMLGNKIFPCEKFIGSWSDVDFALAIIKVKPEDEHILEGIGQNMAFKSEVYQGEKLLTIGHGFADNQDQKMVANQDSDCKVYSQKNDIRFMADPDDVNPGDYSVWSFANGCDVSHGDSGSAMVDRDTGDIVGIIWTGKIPKEAKVQDPAYLADIFSHNSEDVWKQLSYSVPSFKIKEVLTESLQNDDLDVDSAETLRQLLQ